MNTDKQECYFCKLLDVSRRESIPRWIADLQVSTAILEGNQICRGYTILVYNKAHATELFQLEKEDRIAYLEDLNKVARAIYDAYHPHKMNYELLGNIVPHLHWHIIPRRKTDSIELHWPIWGKDYTKKTLPDEEYQKIIEEIRAHLL
jgi:diadenosine tetraphosphate (Ap4A) HIT family hydrolase